MVVCTYEIKDKYLSWIVLAFYIFVGKVKASFGKSWQNSGCREHLVELRIYEKQFMAAN